MMNENRKLRVLALAPYCDGNDVGEAWCAFQWVKHLAEHADVTLLALHRKGAVPLQQQLPNVRVITWSETPTIAGLQRFNSMLKPSYVSYYLKTRNWISQALAAGKEFDVAQQFSPIALRYPSPLALFSIPYVIGPLGGSLETPNGFVEECGSAAWYTQLRKLDTWRLQHDRLLKHSYRNASAVIGVAPYVGELLDAAKPQRFEVMSELGVDELAPRPARENSGDSLNLLHVGRGVRTKGLRDAVRAVAMLPGFLDVKLKSAGQGEEIEVCRKLAHELGVEDRIEFLGQVPRSQVEELYQEADAFLFPSFREPSGSVVFEALRHGLPVITADTGGPGHVIDESCGFTVPAENPEQLARELSEAIVRLTIHTSLRAELAEGAHARLATIGLWQNKIQWLTELYAELANQKPQHLKEAC